MKKLLAVTLVTLSASTGAMAVGNHPMAGCGLAYMLYSSQSNGKVTQILAATTNNIYGTQTFGITSGSSGCTKDGVLAKSKELEVFVAVNLENLKHDIAMGEGSYVNALAALLEVSKDKTSTFASLLHGSYSEIFPSSNVTANDVLASLSEQLKKRPDVLS